MEENDRSSGSKQQREVALNLRSVYIVYINSIDSLYRSTTRSSIYTGVSNALESLYYGNRLPHSLSRYASLRSFRVIQAYYDGTSP